MSDLSQSLALNLANVQRLDDQRDVSTKCAAARQSTTLDDLLIINPKSTVIFPVRDPAAEQYGLNRGDLLVVDRAAQPHQNQLIIILINDELLIRRFFPQPIDDPCVRKRGSGDSSGSTLSRNHPGAIWGVVTYAILKQC
ncbi:MAG: LexA family protein [Betaproteobacteria bacterium]